MPPAPTPTAEARRAHAVFIALLWALSRPGRPHDLPTDPPDPDPLAPWRAVGEALLDLEVSFFTPDPRLRADLVLTGARPAASHAADFLFLTAWDEAALDAAGAASVGSALAPEDGATLVAPARLGEGPARRWSGPGVDGALDVRLGGVPDAFWAARADRVAFPLGWDVIFLDVPFPGGARAVGLPRGVRAEAR